MKSNAVKTMLEYFLVLHMYRHVLEAPMMSFILPCLDYSNATLAGNPSYLTCKTLSEIKTEPMQ